jgi:uncharacterized protein (TIGR03437 family)
MDCSLPANQVTITIQSSLRPSLPGQSVQFNIFVEPVDNLYEPTGEVALADDTTDLGTLTLSHGQASLTRTFTSAGSHVIHAAYNGDLTYCGGFAAYGQPVDRITPTISLVPSGISSPYGALLTLTAQIGPAPPTGVSAPAGPVQFFDSGVLIGAADLVNAKAAFTTAELAAGAHQLTATLIGDPNWYSVRTAPVTVTITPAATTTLLAASATASDVTFSINVNSSGIVPQNGSVRIVDTTDSTTLASLTLPTVSATLPIAKVPVGHTLTAFYSEGTSFAPSTSNTLSLAAFLNAAGTTSSSLAPDEIVSLFGANFATTTTQPNAAQLPTTLAGVTVTLTDRSGAARNAGLYLVAPTQINFVVPTSTAAGPARLTISGANVIPMQVSVNAVAPGLFNPGPQVLHVAPDGAQTLETVSSTTAITIGPDPTYLVLYATGLRYRSSLSAVSASIGSASLPVTYAGPQSQFAGLDQVDLLLPPSLKSAGKVSLILTVDSQATNPIPLQFQ